jgi:hypothetical protein
MTANGISGLAGGAITRGLSNTFRPFLQAAVIEVNHRTFSRWMRRKSA